MSTEGAARVLDVGGAFVMPGLWAMHVHLNDALARLSASSRPGFACRLFGLGVVAGMHERSP